MLIGQLSSDQLQTATTIEPMQQATSADGSIPSADTIPPAADTIPPAADTIPPASENETSASGQPIANEIPRSISRPQSTATLGDRDTLLEEKKTSSRMRPAQLIAEATTIPQSSTITGQPLALLQALSVTADRRQQLAITNAYWKSVETVAKYNFCLNQVNQLGELQSQGDESAILQSARSAASAMLREAELAAQASQYELAAIMQIPANTPLPLPSDRPHVGAYRTNYQELFTSRPAPDRARIIDRILPIRHMAIEQRAVAIQAAQDALIAAIDAHRAGQGGLESVISCSNQLARQQRAFIETVCHYNSDIAEYAMLVAAPGTTPQILVGFMIKTSPIAGQPSKSETDENIRPTSLNEPISHPTTWNNNRPSTFAPRQSMGASAIPTVSPSTQWAPSAMPTKNEPTLAPARESANFQRKNEPTPAAQRGLTPIGIKNEPTLAPPRPEATQQDDKTDSVSPKAEEPAQIRHDSTDPFKRRVEKRYKPVSEVAADTTDAPVYSDQQSTAANTSTNDSIAVSSAGEVASTLLYPALVNATPTVRSKQLALALHWDRSLPEGIGRPMTLEECLSRQFGGDRRTTIEVFWTVRQRAAEYQAIAQEIEFIDNLMPVALEHRAKPTGAVEMLFLRAARLEAKANLHEAQAALVESQFDLALRTQTLADGQWPLSSTPPHAGLYQLNLEAQPRSLVETWPVRRLAATIPACIASLQEYAASVVTADTDREQAFVKYAKGSLSVEQVIEKVSHQTRQTFEFLQLLSEYNLFIAEYALTVLPPNAPANRISAALVVQR